MYKILIAGKDTTKKPLLYTYLVGPYTGDFQRRNHVQDRG